MSPQPDYSLHGKKKYGLLFSGAFMVFLILFIVSLFRWHAALTIVLGLLALNTLLGNIWGRRMPQAKRKAVLLVSAALGKGTGRVLDIGTGPGILAIHLAGEGYDVTGGDIDARSLDRARENAAIAGVSADFQEADGSALPWPDERFDAVTSLNLLHEAQDPAAVLKECRRVLRPGGLLAMADMRRGPATFSIFWFGFFKFLSRKRLTALLGSTGFSDIRIGRATAFHHLIEARKGE